jgi:chromosome segregation ATPase
MTGQRALDPRTPHPAEPDDGKNAQQQIERLRAELRSTDAALTAQACEQLKRKVRNIALEMREARDSFLQAKSRYASAQAEQRAIRLEVGRIKADIVAIDVELADPLLTDAEIAQLERRKAKLILSLDELRQPGQLADAAAAQALQDEVRWAGRYEGLELSFQNAKALSEGRKPGHAAEAGVFLVR